jgi:SAM-dependent methyltransferase
MTNDSATQQEERPGHHWKDPERVREYVGRMDRRAEERRQQLELLARLIPFGTSEPIRVLDIGAGYGAVVSAVLDRFPRASALLLDVSEEMIRVGGERMAPYKGRYTYVFGDFGDGALPAEIVGPFHAAVSSLAIHHVPAQGKQVLYTDVFARLAPGGCFLNLDLVSPPDDSLRELYRRVHEEEREARGEPPPQHGQGGGACGHGEMQTLDSHLTWLREAGFVSVDCFWRRLGMALFGGFRPA